MSTWFTVKVLLHENAVVTLVLAFFILLVLTGDHPERNLEYLSEIWTHVCTGYILRLFEMGVTELVMIDSLWLLLLSVSTVGYGDIYPVTDAGRTVLIMNQILGILVLSALVAVVQSKLSLSHRYVHT